METSQYVNEASPEEADLIRRIVEVKDRIVRLAPGFVEDAEGFRAELRPHNLDIYVKPDDFLEEECDRIAADNWHNVGVACAFASRWGLPVEPTPNVDPSYLADRPFSGAPQIGGTAMAVTEGKEHLPLLRLDIDVRFDADEILNRVRERVGQAKAEWRSGGGDCYEKPSKLCKKLEKMAQVGELRKEMTQEAAAEKIGISSRHLQTLEGELEELLAKRAYYEIAPYTDPRWMYANMTARSDHWNDVPPQGVPREIKVVVRRPRRRM